MNIHRKKVAGLAKQLYRKEISYDEFIAEVPEEGSDFLVDQLIDLVMHEPQKGGFLGVKDAVHQQYIEDIFVLVERLEHEET